MSAVSEWMVREFFELRGFFVQQQRKYAGRGRREDDGVDFLVFNPRPGGNAGAAPFVLGSKDLARVERAVVAVKGWHTDVFSSARLAGIPEILRFATPEVLKRVHKAFGGEAAGELKRILVVPTLPGGRVALEESIAYLRANGVDGVLPFGVVVADLVESVEANLDYHKSDLLQIIRILKNYDFVKDRQLELFRGRKGAKRQRRETGGEGKAG